MAGGVGNLTVGLGLDAAEFTRGLNKAEREAQKFAQHQDALAASAAKFGAAFGAAAVSAGIALAAMVRSQSLAIDKFNDLSDATGASVENISALDRVARETGGSFDTAASTLVKFNKALDDSKTKGSEAGRIFAALGLDAAALRKEDPAEALRKTAVALAQFANDGEKARAVQALFGKSVQEVAPFLTDLAAQTSLVATTTTAAALEAEKFNKELFKIEATATDMARSLSVDLITSINATIDKFREGSKAGESFFQTLRREQLKILGFGKDDVIPAFDSKAGGGRGFVNPPIAMPSLSVPDAPGKPAKVGRSAASIREQVSEGAAYLESLQRQIERTQNLTQVEQVLRDIQMGRIKGLKAGEADRALGLAKQLDDTKAYTDAMRAQQEQGEKFIRTQNEAADAARNEADQIAESLLRYEEQTEVLGKSDEAIRAIEQARISSTIAIKEQALAELYLTDIFGKQTVALEEQIAKLEKWRAAIGQRGEVTKFIEAQREATRQAAELTNAFKDPFTDAFAGFLDGTKTAKEAFQSFADSVIANLAQIAAKQAATAIFGSPGQAGDTGGWIGSIMKLFSSYSGGYATGGTIPAGKWGVVGEQGPELAFGGTTGKTIVPNGAGGQTVHNHITVQAQQGMSRATALQQGVDIARGLELAMRRNGG